MIKVSLFRLTWGSALVTLALTIGALSCASAKPDAGTAETDGIAPTMADAVVPACSGVTSIDSFGDTPIIRQYEYTNRVVVYEGQLDRAVMADRCEAVWYEANTTHCLVVENVKTTEICGGRDDDKQDPNAWSKGGE